MRNYPNCNRVVIELTNGITISVGKYSFGEDGKGRFCAELPMNNGGYLVVWKIGIIYLVEYDIDEECKPVNAHIFTVGRGIKRISIE